MARGARDGRHPRDPLTPHEAHAMTPLPTFKGKVFVRDGSEAYRIHAYQYATTSEADGTMAPAAIVYVADDDDIRAAIAHAKAANIGLAVRSGGHQYLGASSTAGDNIQIDLSGREAPDPATYPYKQSAFDPVEGSLTLGAALDVDEVSALSIAHGVFFPHGECAGVHIGGHTQTGGWSVISRTFGVMIDHLLRFDIILADGTKRTVRRDSTDARDRDLWFAVLGGSPGNFGVVTSITVKVLRDADHPKARGIKLAWFFRAGALRELMQVINEINDDPTIDPDFCLFVIALGEEHDGDVPSILPRTYDDWMMEHHPNLAGQDRFHWVFPALVLMGCWANSKGADQDDSHVAAVFDRLKAVPGMLPFELMQTLFPSTGLMDGTQRMPMSALLRRLTFENAREFNLSAKKLVWFGKNTRTMSKPTALGMTFAEWVAQKVIDMESLKGVFEDPGMKAAIQVGMAGGPGLANPPVRTAMGQRDGNYWFAFDIFYDPAVEGSRERATAFTNGIAADIRRIRQEFWDDGRERRLLLGPMVVDDEAPVLDDLWALFYDRREVYDELLRIKREVDPSHVFTANRFCVGATSSPRFARPPAKDAV